MTRKGFNVECQVIAQKINLWLWNSFCVHTYVSYMKQTLCCSTHSVQEVEKCCVDAVLISPNLPKFVDSECRKIPVSVLISIWTEWTYYRYSTLIYSDILMELILWIKAVLWMCPVCRAVITRVSLHNSDI